MYRTIIRPLYYSDAGYCLPDRHRHDMMWQRATAMASLTMQRDVTWRTYRWWRHLVDPESKRVIVDLWFRMLYCAVLCCVPISFLVKWARSDWVDSEHFRFYLFYFIGCNNFQNCVWVDSSIDRPDLTWPDLSVLFWGPILRLLTSYRHWRYCRWKKCHLRRLR